DLGMVEQLTAEVGRPERNAIRGRRSAERPRRGIADPALEPRRRDLDVAGVRGEPVLDSRGGRARGEDVALRAGAVPIGEVGGLDLPQGLALLPTQELADSLVVVALEPRVRSGALQLRERGGARSLC